MPLILRTILNIKHIDENLHVLGVRLSTKPQIKLCIYRILLQISELLLQIKYKYSKIFILNSYVYALSLSKKYQTKYICAKLICNCATSVYKPQIMKYI